MFSKLGFLLLSTIGITSVVGYTGEVTWFHIFNPAGGEPRPGACGGIHYDEEFVCAVAHGTFDSYPGAGPNPNTNPMCGQKLKVTYGGKSVVVTVVDRCADCDGAANVDLSPRAFSVLADQSAGRLFNAEWEYTTEAPGPSGPGGGVGVSVGVNVRANEPAAPDASVTGAGGKLTPREQVAGLPSLVNGQALPASLKDCEKLKKFSRFPRDVVQERGRMMRRHRRAVVNQSQ